MSELKSVYGIIGNPLTQSLSPLMHNAAFAALGVDALYKAFPLEENELDDFFSELARKDSPVFGLNVTVPYKESVLKYMTSLNPLAVKIQAVNTVVINNKRECTGYNTDAPGFMLHLNELGFDPGDKRIAVLGAGGSAKAILTALCIVPERPASITIYNRSAARLEHLLGDLCGRVNMDIVSPVMSIDDLDIHQSDMLINTTSVGLNEDDSCLVDEDLIHEGLWVYDLIYNPKETLLLRMARDKGAKISNGLGMLYYQGVLALQHWVEAELGEPVKIKMREALEKGLANG